VVVSTNDYYVYVGRGFNYLWNIKMTNKNDYTHIGRQTGSAEKMIAKMTHKNDYTNVGKVEECQICGARRRHEDLLIICKSSLGCKQKKEDK